jgi:hypothetical protein
MRLWSRGPTTVEGPGIAGLLFFLRIQAWESFKIHPAYIPGAVASGGSWLHLAAVGT